MSAIRYKITIEYNGSYYNGWQKQKDNPLTIQECLENALYSIFYEKIEIFGAGRTDAGVNAINQVAHFDLNIDYPTNKIVAGMNFYLLQQNMSLYNEWKKIVKNYKYKSEERFFDITPDLFQNIVVKSCEIVDANFDARFSANMRHYKYLIYNNKFPPAIYANKSWHVRTKLDINAMNEACKLLIGRLDFSSFRASECQAKTPFRTVQNCYFEEKDGFIVFNISAKSFLHHMVRNIVGTLKNVGTHKISVEEFKKIIDAKDRTLAGITAPAYGLYFVGVDY